MQSSEEKGKLCLTIWPDTTLINFKCTDENPCLSCPKDAQHSEWQLLGCQRGNLKEKICPVVCLASSQKEQPFGVPLPTRQLNKDNDVYIAFCANAYMQHHTQKRDKEARHNGTSQAFQIPTLQNFLEDLVKQLSVHNNDSLLVSTLTADDRVARMLPLDECVRSICQELSSLKTPLWVIGNFTLEEMEIFLRSAALHQARNESVCSLYDALIWWALANLASSAKSTYCTIADMPTKLSCDCTTRKIGIS